MRIPCTETLEGGNPISKKLSGIFSSSLLNSGVARFEDVLCFATWKILFILILRAGRKNQADTKVERRWLHRRVLSIPIGRGVESGGKEAFSNLRDDF